MSEFESTLDLADIDTWLDRLESVTPVGSSTWMAKCPGHPDKNPSLSICLGDDDTPLVHCFGGCSYREIVEGLENREPTSVSPVVIKFTNQKTIKNGFSLWLELFGFPPEDLDDFFVGGIDRHLRLEVEKITFLWPSLPASSKSRLALEGEKSFLWSPNSAHPPLWPELEELLDEEIFITEGESDCIVLRRLGLPAYALTTGGSKSSTPRFPQTVIRDLMRRGVKRIVLAFDDDDVGHTTATVVYNQILNVEKTLDDHEILEVVILPVAEITWSFLGEKDLRAVWLRIKDTEAFADEIRYLKSLGDQENPKTKLYTSKEFIARGIPPIEWIVRDVIQSKGICWISGFPKTGKSWVALDLAFSIATGTKFLDYFDVALKGDVLYVVKENSDSSLVSRITKILKRKKSGLHVQTTGGGTVVDVDDSSDVLIDVSREFSFDPQPVEDLIRKVVRHQKSSGRPIRVIIIDPLSFALPHGKFDMNTFADFQRAIVDSIAHITRRTGSAVVLVHHQNKGTDNFTMLGSVAAEASFDNKIAFLSKNLNADHVSGDAVRLQISHRDGGNYTFDLQLRISDEEYVPSLSPVSDDEVRTSSAPKIRVAYLDRQKQVAEVLLALPLGEEFTFRELEQSLRATTPDGEISSSLLNNTFTWMQTTSPPMIEQHLRGKYRRFVGRES